MIEEGCLSCLSCVVAGGDQRNDPGEVFSNWGYVQLSASCLDNRKFALRPVDYANLPHSEQEELQNSAIQKKLSDFKELFKQIQDVI